MPRDNRQAVSIRGLREFRRQLKKISPELDKATREILKDAGELAAAEARRRAPRGSTDRHRSHRDRRYRPGRLAGSIKVSSTQARLSIYSNLPYAAVHEYGGTIRPRGVPIRIKESRMIRGAVEARTDDVIREVEKVTDRLADQAGFH